MPRKFDVAVMHDYFVDRLVHVPSLSGATRMISRKAAAGGGGLHGVVQEEVRGGNAVNLAHALARLGLRTLLITHSERAHEHLLRSSFEGLDAEVRVKPTAAGLTVAMEEKVNVMLGDGRGAADFGPSMLDSGDWDALGRSRVVCSVNWAANRRGTELLVALRRRLGREKTIFVDPADFRDRVPLFAKFLQVTRKDRLADWVSMNEQEAAAAGVALGIGASDPGRLCQELAFRLRVVFDLHGVKASYTSEGTRVAKAAVRSVKPRRLTGAGDVWDAGAIYGRLKGMDEEERLGFANNAAGVYLEREELMPPTAREVGRF
jgi:sugar/nucleoside kinase (ribokinase family)